MTERRFTTTDVETLAGRLPRDLAPERDLWAGVAAQLGDDIAQLETELRELARDIAPARDLWPQIRARIDAESVTDTSTPAWRMLATAASFTAVALISVMLAVFSAQRSVPQRAAADTGDERWWTTLIYDMPQAADAASRDLVAALQVMHDDYRVVQSERRAIEAALDRDPSSAALAALWRHAYTQELALTSRAQEIADNFTRG